MAGSITCAYVRARVHMRARGWYIVCVYTSLSAPAARCNVASDSRIEERGVVHIKPRKVPAHLFRQHHDRWCATLTIVKSYSLMVVKRPKWWVAKGYNVSIKTTLLDDTVLCLRSDPTCSPAGIGHSNGVAPTHASCKRKDGFVTNLCISQYFYQRSICKGT